MVLLAELNIKLISVDEPNLDESAAGKLLRNVIGSMSQYFSDSLSEKTKTRMRAAVSCRTIPMARAHRLHKPAQDVGG